MNEEFISYVMKGAKGVKMPRGDISLMRKYPLSVPSQEEQQKIVACLSSIDDLIAAETQKLDALRTHKKWLMQQLFLAEGETVPKLRFPEFRNAPAWQVKKSSSLFINRVEEGDAGLPIYSVTMNDGMIRR
jgi:type I restriction enzyme S subunit